MSESKALEEHFIGRAPEVWATYQTILKAARKLGPVVEEVKKTSIHLVRRTAFAGIGTRKTYLILTLKSDSDLKSPRIWRRERASSNRWHLEIKLQSPLTVDRELTVWLKRAYELSA